MHYQPSWGFYSYYYIPNYNFYYYRAPSPYYNANYNNNNTSNAYNGADLSPQYNPLDWMPSYRLPFDLATYMTNLNDKMNNVKFYVECCQLFCITYVEAFDDGYNNSNSPKKRIFLDINLRNYLFLDSSEMKPATKKCVLDNIYSKYWNSNSTDTSTIQLTSLNIPDSCGLDTPFKTFPLKNSCKQELNQYCGLNSFNELVNRFFPSNAGQCNMNMLCPNITDTSSDDDRAACGSTLSDKFMTNGYRVSYNGIAYPCSSSTSSTSRIGSFVQTHLMKARLSQNSTVTSNNTVSSNSKYVNETALTPAEKNEVSNTSAIVKATGNVTVIIDSNSNTAANTNVDADLNKINADVSVVGRNTSNSNLFKVTSIISLIILMLI
jgi:hypothetical protein